MHSLGPMSSMPRLIGLFLALAGFAAQAADRPQGLTLSLASGSTTDHVVWPNAQLHVPAGDSASPFLPPGPFTATWSGLVAVELRSDYRFHIEGAGEVRLSLNGNEVLNGKLSPTNSLSSEPVRLTKGTNALLLTYTSPAQGDSFVRLYWSNPETPRNPIPGAVLSHIPSDSLRAAERAHAGRDLFADARCVRCHEVGATPRMPDLDLDAPTLTGIGSRRGHGWLVDWVLNPHSLQPGTIMPAVFKGPDARANAEAVAAFLSSLSGPAPEPVPAGDAEAGRALYEKLLCATCHNPPDATEPDPTKISQKNVKSKFKPGALADFLLKPSRHYAWIRMPDFKLSPAEASHLAAHLLAHAAEGTAGSGPDDEALRSKGRKLVESSGCLNCHMLEGAKSSLAAKPLSDIPAARWTAGCLADSIPDSSPAPAYRFTAEQRDNLRAFAATDRLSLTRHTAADFLNRHSTHLQCTACHGHHEEFPSWDILGGKLRPEWAGPFIAGQDPWKPRPWLEARMPGFPAYARHLAEGLATRHGLPPVTPADAPPVAADIENGRKLVSANGGFSCTSCHGVGEFGATAVFEAPGINLAWSVQRLQQEYYQRWLRSPMSVDPNTKMPGYFDEEGNSPLPEFYEGNGPKTIHAVWQYLQLGPKAPTPE